MSPPFALPLDAPAVALPVTATTTVVLRGSVLTRFDGAEIDAVATHQPSSESAARAIDTGGLVDFSAGGLEVARYDADTHVVHAVAKSGAVAEACARHGTTTPCLVLRTDALAHGRLLTAQQWLSTLQGGVMVELESGAADRPDGAPDLLGGVLRAAGVSAVTLLLLALLLGVVVRARRAGRPLRRFTRLVRSVHHAAADADPILAPVLAPVLDGAARAVRRRRLDPASPQGRRLEAALEQLRAGLLDRAQRRHQQDERDVVDELARDLELALDASEEVSAYG